MNDLNWLIQGICAFICVWVLKEWWKGDPRIHNVAFFLNLVIVSFVLLSLVYSIGRISGIDAQHDSDQATVQKANTEDIKIHDAVSQVLVKQGIPEDKVAKGYPEPVATTLDFADEDLPSLRSIVLASAAYLATAFVYFVDPWKKEEEWPRIGDD